MFIVRLPQMLTGRSASLSTHRRYITLHICYWHQTQVTAVRITYLFRNWNKRCEVGVYMQVAKFC